MKRALVFGVLVLVGFQPLRVGVVHASDAVWKRMVVVGASAASGFGTTSEIGPGAKSVKLADLVDRMIRKKHDTVVDASNSFFFTNPAQTAKELLAKTRSAKPTAIIANDFLFWFAYGGHEDREASLKSGTKLLEDFECPVLITLLPDMSGAVGKMLSRQQVPSVEELENLNVTIKKWARTQKHVIVVPLVSKLQAIRKGEVVKIGAGKWPKGSLPRILQDDQLHPTVEGLAMMAALSLESLVKSKKSRVSSKTFSLQPRKIARQLVEERKEGLK